MRYIPIPIITFEDVNGNSFPVHDRRPIETGQSFRQEITLKGETQLDAITTRRDVYGPDGLSRLYEIFDFNIVRLKEANFNLRNIRTLRIPV